MKLIDAERKHSRTHSEPFRCPDAAGMWSTPFWPVSPSTTAYPSTKPASAPPWSDWNRTTRIEEWLVKVSDGGSWPQRGSERDVYESPSKSWTLSPAQLSDGSIDSRWKFTSNTCTQSLNNKHDLYMQFARIWISLTSVWHTSEYSDKDIFL